MKASGVQLFVVECAFGEQPFVFTSEKNQLHIQVRSKSPLWIKENLINICVAKLPPDWKYIAWIDANVEFANSNWVQDCMKALKQFKVVQMFEECVQLGKEKQPAIRTPGFAYKYIKSTFSSPRKTSPTHNFAFQDINGTEEGCPGLAWAMNKEAYEMLGGLLDFAIAGSGDALIAHALVGGVRKMTGKLKECEYVKEIHEWEKSAVETIRKNVGYVKGSVRVNRRHDVIKEGDYIKKESMLCMAEFNPKVDIKKNMEGIYQFVSPESVLARKFNQHIRALKEDDK